MSDPILDLIDGAIWEHGDAMRWSPEPIDGEEPAFTGPTREDFARLFGIPPELLDDPDSPPRGIISVLPEVPAHEPDLRADLTALLRRLKDHHYVEPEVDSHGRVPYLRLAEDEREALHQWCLTHRVDYKRVPIDPLIEHDPAAGEWRVETYRVRDGKHFLDADGDIAKAILRRTYRADLPWRRP